MRGPLCGSGVVPTYVHEGRHTLLPPLSPKDVSRNACWLACAAFCDYWGSPSAKGCLHVLGAFSS